MEPQTVDRTRQASQRRHLAGRAPVRFVPPGTVGSDLSAPGGENVTYVDRTLTCVDCGAEFVHSAEDQEFYTQKGFVSDPKRCPSCRAARRTMRDAGESSGREGGNGGPREYFAVVCSRCGNQAQVPFKPHMDRPVYCSDCFRIVHAEQAHATGTPSESISGGRLPATAALLSEGYAALLAV